MASLLVGMTRNDVMVNIRGGATCNNNKQFKHVPLAKSLISAMIQHHSHTMS